MAAPERLRYEDDDVRWRSLVHKDRSSVGFVYGVKTTGVYCRSGCSSRRPKRSNVVFFVNPAEAERAGFRACKRCKPKEISGPSRAPSMIELCRSMNEAEEMPPLRMLASMVGVSRYHFQRVFRRVIGITPKQYAVALRSKRLREALEKNRSVTAAILDSGFASLSAAYGSAASMLGMKPSRFKQGGAGAVIRYGLARSCLGWVLVAATNRGICAVELGGGPKDLLRAIRARFSHARIVKGNASFEGLVRRVVSLIETPRDHVDLPLDIQGTAFQQRVWNELKKVVPGETTNYKAIAERLGRPHAARAVGQACASNQLAVIIPCHRAIRGDGSLGGYRWGLDRKRKLLEREANASK